MKLFRHEYGTPEENLACDEALLEACENRVPGAEAGFLRFFESSVPCVVLGYGNRVESEVDVAACLAAGVRILRRTSGGGTVLLGPGCLAYSLILPLDAGKELASVSLANRWIMERNRTALTRVLGRAVEVRGHTDLVVDGRKFSGNAQRRRRNAILFHGTFLITMDLELVAKCLNKPSAEPDYRAGRGHLEFLVNLGGGSDPIRHALRREWGITGDWDGDVGGPVGVLVAGKYRRVDWITRM